MADWYRQKSWSKVDEEYFFTKLGRARKDGRAQYLKIQAIELVETKNEKLLDVAESLIHKLFSECPDDKFNRPGALVALGNICQLRNDNDRAIECYKEAIDFEIIYPQVRTQAYLYFSELVIKQEKVNLYDTVENILTDKIPGTLFPIEKYKGYSILSIINNYKHNIEQAAKFETLAEQNASKETCELRYHKYLGIVKDRESWLDKLVRKS
jgi:tetratricopeptide (TPR) repeat protein